MISGMERATSGVNSAVNNSYPVPLANLFREFDESMCRSAKRINLKRRMAEVRLSLWVIDIIDELDMLRVLFSTQIDFYKGWWTTLTLNACVASNWHVHPSRKNN